MEVLIRAVVVFVLSTADLDTLPSLFWRYMPRDEMWGSLVLDTGRSWIGRWDLGWGLG